jgi:pilus assembly protein Flp/PilA
VFYKGKGLKKIKLGGSKMLNYLMTWMKCKFGEEDGQAMAEYGLIIALVAVLLIASILVFKDALASVFQSIIDGFGGTAPSS